MISDVIIKQNISNDLLRCSRIDRISDSTRDLLLDNVQDINGLVINMLKGLMTYIDKNCPKNIQDMTRKINEEVKSTLKACNLTDLDDQNDNEYCNGSITSSKWNSLMDKIEKNDTTGIKLDGSSNPMTSVTQSDISAMYCSNSDFAEDENNDNKTKKTRKQRKTRAKKEKKNRDA